jgi:hypothetical protein
MISKDREHPVKKFAMLTYWRTQQISQIFSTVMLAFTLALSLNLYIEWRFGNTYIGIVLTLIALGVIILVVGYLWDKKLKMWHEQSVVGVERNPFNMHKLATKEVFMYKRLWIPTMKALGTLTNDAELLGSANDLDEWCDDQMVKDANLRASVDELIRRHSGRPT